MLYFFHNNVFSVNCEKYVAGFKMDCVSPALAWYVEGMGRCCDYLLTVNRYVNKLVGFINYCVGYVESLFASPDAVFNILIIHLK